MDKISSKDLISEWIDTYQNLIFSVCYKYTKDYFVAEDLTQETFLSAYRHMDTFQGGNEKAWLCRIASNKSMDYLKEAGRRMVPTEDVVLEEKVSEDGSPEGQYLEQEVRNQLLDNCRHLKPPYDEVATMYFYEEKSAEEISRKRNKNLKTIQTQIYRARGMLRKIYGKENC